MKKFYILNTSLFPNHGTHIISNRKLGKGFEQNGYEIIEIDDNNLSRIENKRDNIIILSNFMDFNKNMDQIIEFSKKYDNIYYILWFWFNIQNIPFKYWVHTFQEYKYEPENIEYKNLYLQFIELTEQNKFIPYCFSSYIDPLSNYKEKNAIKKEIDVLYIGNHYELETLSVIKKQNFNHFIHLSWGGVDAITGDIFEEYYRKSKIVLGLMCPLNNASHTVTERIWEALSFGCLVLTNSKTAEKITDGVVVYYKDVDDLLEKIKFYLENEEERLKKIEKGYDIFISERNYKKNAKQFIEHLNSLL